jgi:protein transport protein SEC31
MVLDMPTSVQWAFDVSFCPRNPVLISTSSFDGRISLYSLAGGTQLPVTSSNLAESFPGMDLNMTHAPVPAQKPLSLNLRDAPKWLKRPCGASFAVSRTVHPYPYPNYKLQICLK